MIFSYILYYVIIRILCYVLNQTNGVLFRILLEHFYRKSKM